MTNGGASAEADCADIGTCDEPRCASGEACAANATIAAVGRTPPVAFHFVYSSSPWIGDSIVELAQERSDVLLVSTTRPAAVDGSRWAAYRSYRTDPRPSADDLDALLRSGDPPRLVMIEELHDEASAAYLAELADDMMTRYPEWRGRFGAFVAFGHYARWSAAIDALLRADATLALELYPRQSEYCAAGASGGARDRWLAQQFNGTSSLARLRWLMARRALRQSASNIAPLFGVGDVLLDGPQPARFLDRMFYVWVTRTEHPALIGSAGAYKWQRLDETPLGYGVSNTSRDLAFVQSFSHYAINDARTSLKGPVTCP